MCWIEGFFIWDGVKNIISFDKVVAADKSFEIKQIRMKMIIHAVINSLLLTLLPFFLGL